MAKAKETVPPEEPSQSTDDEAKQSTEPAEESPQIRSAADAVARAEAELLKARKLYETVRDEAVEKVQKAREATLGDVMDATLDTVKRHPGPGVLVAIALGFFFGRLFRR